MATNQEPLNEQPESIQDLCKDFNALCRRLAGRELDLSANYNRNRPWEELYQGDVNKLENAMRFAFQFLKSAAGDSRKYREELIGILSKGADFKSKSAIVYANMALMSAEELSFSDDQKAAIITILASGLSAYPQEVMEGAAMALQQLSPQIDDVHAQALASIIAEGAAYDYQTALQYAQTLHEDASVDENALLSLDETLRTSAPGNQPSRYPQLT